MPQAIAIAVVEHEGRFLVGQRPPGVSLSGLAEFPGGKVQPGEAPDKAAARECTEETGLQVQACQRIDTILHAYEHATVELHFFACRLIFADQAESPRPPFAWLTLDELAKCEFPAANNAVIQRLTRPVKNQ